MNKKNLKIPENVHVHENFRTWKSGKQWLYASSVLALIVAGGAIAAPSVKADQVLPGQQTGADNTATGALGSNAGSSGAGSNNVSLANSANNVNYSSAQSAAVASSSNPLSANPSSYTDGSVVNSNSSQLKTDSGVAENSVATNTNGSYAVQDLNSSGVAGTATGSSAQASLATPGSSDAILKTSDTNLNSNGAVTAGSGASSSVSFDIKDTQQVPGALNIVNGATGSYTWTVSAPSDLTNAGLSVANVNVAYDASKGDGALNVNGNEAYYQTAGGDYVIGTENVPGYPTGSSAASMFTPTESAASIMASASSVAASYSDANIALASQYADAQSLYNSYYAANGFDGTAASYANNLVAIQASIASNNNAIAALDIGSTPGYLRSSVASQAVVNITYTTDSNVASQLNTAFTAAWGTVVAGPIPGIAQGISNVIQGIANNLGNALNGNIVSSLITTIANGVLQTVTAVTNGLIPTDVIQNFITNTVNSAFGSTNISLNGLLSGGTSVITNALNSIFGAQLPIINQSIGQLVGVNVSGITQGIQTGMGQVSSLINTLATALNGYAANVQASQDQMTALAKEVPEVINANGTFNESFLANVTQNADGTYTVSDTGSHSPLTALTNKVALVVNGYIQATSAGLKTIVTIPQTLIDAIAGLSNFNLGLNTGSFLDGVFNTVINGVVNGVGSFASSAMQGLNSVTAGASDLVNNTSNWVTQSTSNIVSQVVNSIANASATGVATVTVGFTAADPSSQIATNLATANHYYQGQSAATTQRQLDNVFVPETFKVTPTALAGQTNTTTDYTSVVYQYNTNTVKGSIVPVDSTGKAIANAKATAYEKYSDETVNAPTAPAGYVLNNVNNKAVSVADANGVINFVYDAIQPTLTTKDSTIDEGSTWTAADNFTGGTSSTGTVLTTNPTDGTGGGNTTNPSDSNTIVLPGQDGKLGTADDVTVTGDQPLSPGSDGSVTLPSDGGKVDRPDGSYNVPGGTVVDPDGTIHLPGGTVINPGGSVTVPGPDGKTGTDDDTTLNPNSPVVPGDNGSVTLPGGGTASTPNGNITLPGGTVVDPDGTIHLPGGDIVNPDGTVTLPGQDGKTGTGDDGKIKPNGPIIPGDNGSVTLPGGGTVTTPGGTINVPGGSVVDPDGTVHLPGGDIVNPDGTIALPGQDGKTGTGDDGKVKPNGPSISNPDGSITLPGGGTVTTPGGMIQ
ncbi:KxYKxGKxW signal peptide domain-containing protein [Lactococcus lactis]|uniref:KxYKxGKxW signal peptide domain-containing protein n=1 Tax=Lactococcus lactis TaxID=1358 RepID=UPI002016E9EF|nr:KxYKxGKxW signal peptide domain-containing protein [Lactococcus lactis]